MKVAVYAVGASSSHPGRAFANKRSRYLAAATLQGLARHGVECVPCIAFDGVIADVAIAYGWVHEPIFTKYKQAGARFAYWDLGYWNRRPKNAPQDGHHRLAIDDWDTKLMMLRGCPGDRFDQIGIKVREAQKPGDNILIAGMSDKAAGTHGYEYNAWEDAMMLNLSRMAPGESIVMRPKPNKKHRANTTIEQDLQNAKLLVTHHSNAAVDALIAGVPIYCVKGVASVLSRSELWAEDLADPSALLPPLEQRQQLMHDIAYMQWSVPEMRDGQAWEHIRRVLCA